MWPFYTPNPSILPKPPEPPKQPIPCRHLHTRVEICHVFAHGWCCDCGSEVNLAIVFDNWIRRFEEIEKRMEEPNQQTGNK